MDMGYDEYDKWLAEQIAKIGDYENPAQGCPNCSRHRVMIGDDGKHRCEKCYWCIEDNQYDRDFSEFMS